MVYSMPASTRSRVNDCSQTRSGIHMPRTVAPRRFCSQRRIAADLADAVAGGDHRQDRLVEGPADDLDPALGDQLGQAVEILGMLDVEPFHQRAAGVQADLQRLVAAEDVEKRPVAVLVGLLEDVVEIADGLMIVEDQDESNGIGHFGNL